MTVDPAHDWQDRIDQAEKRLGEVETLMETFLADDPYGIVRETKPQGGNRFVLIARMTEHKQVPRQVSILLAEIFGHLRSSLDHLMDALASDPATGDSPAGTQFPIFLDPPIFHGLDSKGNPKKGSGLYQMRGGAPAVQTLIEGMQPYHRGAAAASDPLWVLHRFAVIDKHKKPHLTGAVMEGGSIGIKNMWGVDLFLEHWGFAGPFHKGTQAGRIEFTVTQPDNFVVEMDAKFTYQVAFDPKGPGAGAPVVSTVQPLIAHLRGVVFPQLEPFV
jgi:hypothetical protein